MAANKFFNFYVREKTSYVVIDEDEAMCNVVCHLILEARHCIYVWHVEKNVCSNLKGAETQREFFFHMIFVGLTIKVYWEVC